MPTRTKAKTKQTVAPAPAVPSPLPQTHNSPVADQNERDHAALVAAVRAGKVEARQVE